MPKTAPTPLTLDDLRAAYASYGRPYERWRIGAEFERHLIDGSGRPAPYDGRHGVRELLHALTAQGWTPSYEGAAPVMLLKDGASLTLEPGAQVELSGAPHRTVAEVVDEAARFARSVDAAIADGPYTQVALGYTPYADVDTIPWVPKGRYAIMRAHMAASGTLGHAMMKGTAATQASFDYSDEADAARKMRVASALAPLITAIFANSPYVRGRDSGFQSWRAWVWAHTDDARTGFPPAALDFSFDAWIDYLLDVPMMFTHKQGRWAPAHGRTFRTWLLHGDADGDLPTEADWDLHLTSVFPEVRIKRQIEVRMADCVPLDLAAAFCALFEGMFYCPRSLRDATALAMRFTRFGTPRERFVTAARRGLHGWVGGRPLVAWAEELLDDAVAGLSRCEPDAVHWLDPIVALVGHGQSPADRLLEALGPTPDPSALRAATHPLVPWDGH